ncbi:MAG: transcription initiation factor IIB family protein [Desulfurococcaceae archaeon]
MDVYGNLANLSFDIISTAKFLAERAIKEEIALGFKPEEVAVTSIYIACRNHRIPLLLKDLIAMARVEASRVKGLYRKIHRYMRVRAPIPDPEDYLLRRLAPALSVDEEIARSALEIIKRAKTNMLTQGKNPSGVAAAALYIALRYRRKPVSISKLARVSGVTTVTIKNILKILSSLR